MQWLRFISLEQRVKFAQFCNMEETDLYWETLNITTGWNTSLGFPEELSTLHTVIAPTLCAFVVVLGLVGNGLVILAVMLSPQMRTRHENLLIVNLAVVNLFFLAVCVPLFGVVWTMEHWPFGRGLCKFWNYMILFTYTVCVYSLVVMSLERLLVAWNPSKNRNCFCASAVATLWIVCGVVHAYYPLKHDILPSSLRMPSGGQITYCMPGGLNLRVFYGVLFVVGYVLPLVIICCVYTAVTIIIRSRNPLAKGHRHARLKQVTVQMAALVVAFAVCWLPYYVLTMESIFGELIIRRSVHAEWIHLFASVCSYFHACINPVLYALLSPAYRDRFRLFLCCRKREKVEYVTMASEEQRLSDISQLDHASTPNKTTAV